MKKARIIVIIVLLLLLILAGVILVKLNQEKEAKEWAETRDENMEVDIEEHIIPVRGQDEFFSIEKLMTNYYLYLQMGNQDAVYQVLADSYKSTNQITSSNAISIAQRTSGTGESFRAREMYYKDDLTNPIYLVYGIIETNNQGKECYALVYIDNENSTYAVEPIQARAYENYRTEKTELVSIETIEKNDYNKYAKMTVTEEEMITRYFETWLKENLFYTDYAYSRLDTEYQKAKYPTRSSYQEYVTNHQEQFTSMLPEMMKQYEDFESEEEYFNYLNTYEVKGLDQYKIEETDEYTQYTLIDDYGNYYIIRATSPMNYTVLLDTYTIDLPEFVEQYNQANVEGKMQLNLIKLFTAINAGDYEYAYQKLNETYRNENFPTLADFENYVKENFFAKNTIGVSNFETYDYIYRYEVTIKNEEQPNATYAVKKTFSMSLGEGTEFEYSFNRE